MAVTKQVLTFQSDQVLDSPQIKTKLALKTLPGDKTLNLTFTAPVGADRDVNFPDPGANDTVVYANLAQVLTNKTLTTGIILPDQPQYAHLAGQAGGQTLQGGTAAGEHLSLESTANVAKGQVRVKDDLQMAAGKNLIVQGGGELTGLPATPSGNTAATSKLYVDTQVTLATAGGVSWRETVLEALQLDSVNKAISQAVAFFFTGLPTPGDILSITDGGTTETFTAVAGAPGPFQFTIGVSTATTNTNLATAINSDSVVWSAIDVTNLQSIHVTGDVLIITRKVPTGTVNDRIYGTFTGNVGSYVNYGGLYDYRDSTNAVLPAADPTTANFGFSRITASLSPEEVHITRAGGSIYEWDPDAGTWVSSGAGVILATSAPGGGVIGQTSFDSNKGITTAAGVTGVNVDGVSVQFTGGALSSPVGTSAPGGSTPGRLGVDENFGLIVVGGNLRTRVDGTSITYAAGVMKANQQTETQSYLSPGVFGNIVGPATVSGETNYPNFATNFERFYVLSSTSPGAGEIDVAFEGRLATFQTTVSEVRLHHIALSGAPSMTVKIYFEGAGAVPVYTSVILPGAITELVVNTSIFVQPIGSKRFYVVVEGHFAAVSSLGVSLPFVKMV